MELDSIRSCLSLLLLRSLASVVAVLVLVFLLLPSFLLAMFSLLDLVKPNECWPDKNDWNDSNSYSKDYPLSNVSSTEEQDYLYASSTSTEAEQENENETVHPRILEDQQNDRD